MICVCPNKKKGCSWEGKYYLRNKHVEKECEFIDKELCPNEGCKKKIKSEDIKTHSEEECDYRKILCDKCKKCITFKDKAKHAEECEKRLRKQFMGEDIDKKDFKVQWSEFKQTLSKKYGGKKVLKLVN